MRHSLGLLLGLITLWLLLSGHHEPLMLALGALSCAATFYLCRRMALVDGEAVPVALLPRLPGYLLWLLGAIARSSAAIAPRLVRGRGAIQPRLMTCDLSAYGPLTQALIANTITLTPGTVTIALEDGRATVHALTDEAAAGFANDDVATRVARLTRESD